METEKTLTQVQKKKKKKKKAKGTEKRYKELVEEGRETTEARDNAQWKHGDEAVEVAETEWEYGGHTVENFADDINVEYSTLRNYKAVSKKFEFVTRVTILLPWSFFRTVVGLDLSTAMALLKEAKKKGWTRRQLEAAVKALKSKTPPLPKGPFDVIYADPPWEYEFSMSPRGDPERHYNTMTVEEICALKIPTTENALLFLWATNPKLEEVFEVIEAWGFTYRTNMVWVKDKFGTGYYVRGQHELLLIARKGDVYPPEESYRPPSVFRPPSVLIAPRMEHSAKPQEVYKIIEHMYPNGKYVELFARKKREGWVSWGHGV